MTIQESVELINADLKDLREYGTTIQTKYGNGDDLPIRLASRKQVLAEIIRVYNNAILHKDLHKVVNQGI